MVFLLMLVVMERQNPDPRSLKRLMRTCFYILNTLKIHWIHVPLFIGPKKIHKM